jgi:predicted transcriptional regulator
MATLTTKEIAEKIGTEPRTLRKFLRSEAVESGGKVGEDTPGKGGRYSIEAKEFRGLQKRFEAWSEAHTRSADEIDETPETELDEIGA